MSYCPLGDNSGFIRWSDGLTEPVFAAIQQNAAPPVHLATSMNKIPHAIVNGNHIEDLTGHTCTYASKSYVITDIQICTPLHAVDKSYRLPSQLSSAPAVAELIICFVINSSDKANPSSLNGMMLCLPIYVDSVSSSNAAYLEQIMDSHLDIEKIQGMESLFRDKDFGSFFYTTCFETIASSAVSKKSLGILVFPQGIRVTTATFPLERFRPTPFRMPASIRDGASTMKSYTIDALGMKVPTWSSDGEIYITQVNPGSAAFKSLFPYYRYSIRNTSGKSGIDTVRYKCTPYDPSSGADTNNQRCVPFDDSPDTGDYRNSHVIPGKTTLKTVLAEQYALQSDQNKITTVKENLSENVIAAILAGILALLFVVVFYQLYSGKSGTPVKVPVNRIPAAMPSS